MIPESAEIIRKIKAIITHSAAARKFTQKSIGNVQIGTTQIVDIRTMIPIRHDVFDSKTYAVELSRENAYATATTVWAIASLAEILSTTTTTDIEKIKEQVKTNCKTQLIDPLPDGSAENIEKKQNAEKAARICIEKAINAVLRNGIPEDRKITKQMIEDAHMEALISSNSYIIARYTGTESLANYIASLCQGNQLDNTRSAPLKETTQTQTTSCNKFS